MENQTNQTSQAINEVTIKFSAVAILPESEESETLWIGGRKNSTRNIQLSQPIPQITASDVENLPKETIAEFLNSEFADYIKRVKTQRMELGDSLTLNLPASGLELAFTILTSLTEGTRVKKELSGSTIREAINSDCFKQHAAALCKLRNISAENFKRIVVDEFLRACVRSDFTIYESRTAVAAKAIGHISYIAAACKNADSKTSRTLELAAQMIANAPTVSDDAAI